MTIGPIPEFLSSLKSYRLPPEDIRAIQNRRLRALVRFAYERVPYYHGVMRSGGLRPENIDDVIHLVKLPFLTKTIITQNLPDGLLAKGVKVESSRRTSGTTGTPITFHRGPLTQRRILALKLRRMYFTGVKFWEKAVYLPYFGNDVPAEATLNGPRPRRTLSRFLQMMPNPRDLVIGYRVLPLGRNNLGAVSRMVANYRPSILRSRPSHLRRLAAHLPPGFSVRRVFTEGEVLTKGTRMDLEDRLNTEVFDEYGASEVSGLGFECNYHGGIHLYSDYFAFEFLARDGAPAGEGERAELVVTGLMDDAMPLIRYRIGDCVVRGHEERCACGSFLPKLTRVEGRIADGLLASGGEAVASGSIVDHFETELGLRDFQVIQEGECQFVLKTPGVPSPELVLAAKAYLSEAMKQSIDLRVEGWKNGEMPMKFRPVINSQFQVAPMAQSR